MRTIYLKLGDLVLYFRLTRVEEWIICQRHSIHCVETDAFGGINTFAVADPQHQIFNCVLSRIHICEFKTILVRV